jgi:hypothetical protein
MKGFVTMENARDRTHRKARELSNGMVTVSFSAENQKLEPFIEVRKRQLPVRDSRRLQKIGLFLRRVLLGSASRQNQK